MAEESGTAPGQNWGPERVVPGKREKEVTHVIRVEAFAHAGRHIESALHSTEPHRVWNVVAEKPQRPEPCKKSAGCASSNASIHHWRSPSFSAVQTRWKPGTRPLCASRCLKARPGFAVHKRFRCPLPIASAETALSAIAPCGARRVGATSVPRATVAKLLRSGRAGRN